MDARHVVTAVIRYNGKILLLKRSPNRKHHANKWENVGGGIEDGETLENALVREVFEETGLTGKIIRSGKDFEVLADNHLHHVYPFLFEAETDKVKLSDEHTEFKWINIPDFINLDCVDGIELDFKYLDLI